jgi:hypothetical protein
MLGQTGSILSFPDLWAEPLRVGIGVSSEMRAFVWVTTVDTD